MTDLVSDAGQLYSQSKLHATGLVSCCNRQAKELHHEATAQDGRDPVVRTLAQNLLPTLQDHLAEAQELANAGGHSAMNSPTSGAMPTPGAAKSL